MTDRTLREKIAALTEFAFDGYPGVYLSKSAVTAILDAHTAEPDTPPITAAMAAAACTCGDCGGLVCCQNCGTPPSPAPDAVVEAPVSLEEQLERGFFKMTPSEISDRLAAIAKRNRT